MCLVNKNIKVFVSFTIYVINSPMFINIDHLPKEKRLSIHTITVSFTAIVKKYDEIIQDFCRDSFI